MLKSVGKNSKTDVDIEFYKGPVFEFPKKFQYPPNMPKYSGKSNPKDFIFEFLETTCCYAKNIGLHIHLLR